MNISLWDGSVQLTDEIRLYPGMSREEIRMIRDCYMPLMARNEINDICNIMIPDCPLYALLRLKNNRLYEVVLSVPYRNSFPMMRDDQEEYMADCLEEDFLEMFEKNVPPGRFLWGQAEFRWFSMENTLNLVLTYNQEMLV